MEYRIIEGLDNMELSDIVRLLRTTYWAGDRPVEVIETALKNSRCFGIRLPGSNTLAAFARVVSDSYPARPTPACGASSSPGMPTASTANSASTPPAIGSW